MPVQARSAATVDAILQATIQVLLQAGREHLTTTRVAARAGVSVGTLYQYFPNKSALLQATLERHLGQLTEAIERACQQHHGHTLREMATALVTAFLEAKLRDLKTSIAMYAVSADVDGARVVRKMQTHTHRAIVRMLNTAPQPLNTDPSLVAAMLMSTMAGASRQMLEGSMPASQRAAMGKELITLACAYVAQTASS